MSTCYYIKRPKYFSIEFGQIFRVQEVEYISYNTGTRALPDISGKALLLVLYTYNLYIYHFNTSDQREKPVYKSHIALALES